METNRCRDETDCLRQCVGMDLKSAGTVDMGPKSYSRADICKVHFLFMLVVVDMLGNRDCGGKRPSEVLC